MEPHEIIIRPVVSESALERVEKQNELTFIVNLKAAKAQVKWAVEKLYDVKVMKVNTLITMRGEKKAYVKLTPAYKASDVAIKLGIL